MIDIQFEVNGKKVRPSQIKNELERALLDGVRNEVARKLRGVHDPETGERPKVTVKGRSLDDLSFEVSGPETLIEEVKKKLG